MRSAVALLLLALTIEGWNAPALAHDHGFGSWIGKERISDPVTGEWCCDADDCKEMVSAAATDFNPATQERGSVTQLPNGNYLVSSTGEEIDAKRIIWRSPGSWWRCHRPNGSTRCLLGPPPGS